METLWKIQQALKVPKDNKNRFGGFTYRTTEDICKAVKPLLEECEATLTLTDEVVLIGEWNYVKSRATLSTKDSTVIFAEAYAREAPTKKKFDEPQLTGAASSYARKNALCGLFLIDDGVDADAVYEDDPEEELDKREEEEKPYNEKNEIPDDEMPFNADEEETPKRRRRKRR